MTTDKPKKAGYYWFKISRTAEPEVVLVVPDLFVQMFGRDDFLPLDHMIFKNGTWSDPLISENSD